MALRALDLDGSDANAIALVKDLVAGNRLPVDADEIVARLAFRQALREKSGDAGAGLDLDMVGETAAEVVDEKDLHVLPPQFGV